MNEFYMIVDAQGWNSDTQLDLALRFIEESEMGGEFGAFCDVIADLENV